MTTHATEHVPPEAGRGALSVAERVALGKAARAAAPRSSQAIHEPAPTRADPVALLEQQAESRVPELIAIRYGRMLVSPFTFYRGAAAIMTADLAATPNSGLTVQCCGDAHLSNFGVFASAERRLVFDLNDFDETLPGPWEWDVKRLATSMLIAARDNGFTAKQQERIVLATAAAYRRAMRDFATMSPLQVWYENLAIEQTLRDVASGGGKVSAKQVARAKRTLAKAHTRDSMSALRKLTEIVDGRPQIVDQSPLIVPLVKLATEIGDDVILGELNRLFDLYRGSLAPDRRALLDEYELRDYARKVVGVGSVGTRAWITLLTARDDRDPLFLQIKEAQPSVLEASCGASEFPNHGQRVVVGQRLMQASSDILLGWLNVEAGLDGQPHDFYVRQLKDWKGSAIVEEMIPRGMAIYGGWCGWTLARAHARSGDRIAIAAYLGSGEQFDRALLEFSIAYAEQNDRDYAALTEAVESGRLTAEVGV
jgi:uncharacterized protein (DUF2252 family)